MSEGWHGTWVRVSDPKYPELVLVAYSVSTVATVVWTARALARERPGARKTIRLGTEAKAPADKEIPGPHHGVKKTIVKRSRSPSC